MYKTVRQGDNCLQYTILPQQDLDNPPAAMTVRTGRKLSLVKRNHRLRPVVVLVITLLLGLAVVAGAVLLPLILSTDLESYSVALNFGGAGQSASFNPNVHHPPGTVAPWRQSPLSEEDDDDDDYLNNPRSMDEPQYVAIISVTEGPAAPQTTTMDSALMTKIRAVAFADNLPTTRASQASQLRNPFPQGLPPSLLPQRQLPERPDWTSIEDMTSLYHKKKTIREYGPGPSNKPHRKTNNGLYTNEDEEDHNLDLTRGTVRNASTRIFVEALLPSSGDSPGEPAPPQKRSWIKDPAAFFKWTGYVSVLLALIAAVAAILFVCARRRRRHCGPSSPRPNVRRDSKTIEIPGPDKATLLADGGSEEDA